MQPPAQEIVAKDVHEQTWMFRHVFRGLPKRHLLTTGWGVFVSSKRLFAGDSIVFIRDEKSQLLLGIKRANRQQLALSSSVITSDSMHIGLLAAAAHAAANNRPFTIFYNPRVCPSDFVIPLAKYNKSLCTQVSLGMRFRMMFETEDSGVRRYMGTITGISDLDPVGWKNSEWRTLEVGWDESATGPRPSRVSIWEIEPVIYPFYVCPPTFLRPKFPKQPVFPENESDMENILRRGVPWLDDLIVKDTSSTIFPSLNLAQWMNMQQNPGSSSTFLHNNLRTDDPSKLLNFQSPSLPTPCLQFSEASKLTEAIQPLQPASITSPQPKQQSKQQQQQLMLQSAHVSNDISSPYQIPSQNLQPSVLCSRITQKNISSTSTSTFHQFLLPSLPEQLPQLQLLHKLQHQQQFSSHASPYLEWMRQHEQAHYQNKQSQQPPVSQNQSTLNQFTDGEAPSSSTSPLMRWSLFPEDYVVGPTSNRVEELESEPDIQIKHEIPGSPCVTSQHLNRSASDIHLRKNVNFAANIQGLKPDVLLSKRFDSRKDIQIMLRDYGGMAWGIEAELSTTAAINSLPFGVPNMAFEAGSSADMAMNQSGRLGGGQWSNQTRRKRTYTKVQKHGSVGRTIDVTRYKGYDELRHDLACMFGIEGQLEESRRTKWKLVYVDHENDILLVGDDPWEEFVTCVQSIKILSATEVQQMSLDGDLGLASLPKQASTEIESGNAWSAL
ncbi:hypothetical protein NMG60_11005639 [Bertholletia excelsa]